MAYVFSLCFILANEREREKDRQTDRQTDVLNSFEQTDVVFDARGKASEQKSYSSVNLNAMMWICVPKKSCLKLTILFACENLLLHQQCDVEVFL